MSKQTKFHGILAVGRTKASAVNNYRLLAMGKGAAVQVDGERNIAFVTHASNADGMFNPMSGNMDLETDEALCAELEFQSESSGDVSVNHLVCESGCGTHVIFDSDTLVKYCPNCTSSLSEADDEDEGDDADEDESDGGEEDEFEAESSDDGDDDSDDDDGGDDLGEDEDFSDDGDDDDVNEDDTSESADDAGEDEDDAEDDGDDSDLSDEDGEDAAGDEGEDAGEEGDDAAGDSGEEGDDAAEDEELPPLDDDDGDVVIAADSLSAATQLLRENLPQTSLSSGNIDAHYMRCSSSDCGAHVVSTVEVADCPACHSSLVEPESEDDGGEGEDSDENTLSLTDEDSGNVLEEDTEELDADADIDEESDSADLDVSYSSSVAGQAAWTAYFKGVPVAMASKSAAGNNADIFDTPKFGQAALATAKVAGVKKALAELGFKPIKHKVSVSAEVRRMVDKQVNEQRQSISADQASYEASFMAALATAALGINRGFFTDVENPIKKSLWAALNSAGIRSPETLIDNVFKSHSDAYHKVLFAQAKDIVSKPKDVQESLAKAVLGTAYQAVSSSADDNTLESRLETLGTSESSAQPVPATAAPAPVAGPDQKRAVQSLGRHFR